MNQTCMCWGMECGDGWYHLLDTLCEAMTYTYTTGVTVGDKHISVEAPQVVADQVKEKYGTLRFHFHLDFTDEFQKLHDESEEAKKVADRYQNYFEGIVHMAEVLSGNTCEETGLSGEMHVTGSRRGWYKTLNVEYAKTNAECINRHYVPVSSLPEEKEP